MLNTRGSNRRSTRNKRTPFGVAGLAIGAVVLGGGLFLAGCSAGSAASSAASNPSANAAAGAAAAPAPVAGAAGQLGGTKNAGSTGTTARLAPASDIIYTAQLTVRAANVSSAVTQAAQIAEGAGGYVSGENSTADPDHPSQATASIQLKIPVASYPATLGRLAGLLGTQLALQEQAQDVTEQVADVSSQVVSYQAAIAQLRALLSHAGSVGDLLTVQNQINTEEAALEGMQAQQRALSDETSYATVSLTIVGPKAAPVVHRTKTEVAQPGRRPRRGLACAADHGGLDARLPRRDRAVRGHRGPGRLRDLPGQALGAAPQACRPAGRAGELAAG